MDLADRDALAARYRKLDEEHLLELALQPGELNQLARRALADELASRQLFPRLRVALQHDVEAFSDSELDALVATIQQRPCPMCGSAEGSLNAGGVINSKLSATLFFGVIETADNFYVGCTPCLKSKAVRGVRKPDRSGRTRPTRAMTEFVFAGACLFLEFADAPGVVDAALSLDGARVLQEIADLGAR